GRRQGTRDGTRGKRVRLGEERGEVAPECVPRITAVFVSENNNRTKSSVGPFLLAAFAAVCLLAFFSYRGDDVGRLGELIGDLGGGPLFGQGAIGSITGVAAAFAILLAWLGLGSFVVRFIPTTKGSEHSHILELAMSVAVGAGIWSLIWFILGITGAYSPWIALAAVMIGIALNIFTFTRAREATDESRVPETASGFDRLLLI